MNIVTQLDDWQVIRKKNNNKNIGFVHTMGHLHAGHLSLCARSQAENDLTVLAIFVNATQFNQIEDFDHYPRTLEEDKALLRKQKVDYLLLLDAAIIYGDNYQIQIHDISDLSKELEAKFRPGHFTGMLTVVLKYLNIVKPTRSYYGEKDFQQLLLIKKMAQALFLETEIIGCPTIRAADGLALSSRNTRLNLEQRAKAGHFPTILQRASSSEEAMQQLKTLGFRVDYVTDHWGKRLAAVYVGEVRLIDALPISA
ncbi:pantoate--beta-alanine ligase [Rickettsiella endosymbiont of Litargus connexus]|jgi:pantoate--beta-alanine ligase|uniref:pantoate--beta-alanine ligase n=1 Tax=Rickettsiella endosymbiont of Litargus connexus TaxID=3066237 RepID=UPI0027E7D362|nr:pantoate--beta-alanine ligase [Candidatus Rickettsiella isopodorum]MDQ5900114.1 pantoate--beta-alanine ligase [Pseudomonadota bacterium]